MNPQSPAVQKDETRTGWQPIETAPRDGTNVLLWNGYHMEVASWGYTNPWKHREDWCVGQCFGDYNSYSTADEPTHWHPLPAEPTK